MGSGTDGALQGGMRIHGGGGKTDRVARTAAGTRRSTLGTDNVAHSTPR